MFPEAAALATPSRFGWGQVQHCRRFGSGAVRRGAFERVPAAAPARPPCRPALLLVAAAAVRAAGGGRVAASRDRYLRWHASRAAIPAIALRRKRDLSRARGMHAVASACAHAARASRTLCHLAAPRPRSGAARVQRSVLRASAEADHEWLGSPRVLHERGARGVTMRALHLRWLAVRVGLLPDTARLAGLVENRRRSRGRTKIPSE